MAGVSDGAIIIDTKLDNSGFMRDAKKFKGAVDGLKNSAQLMRYLSSALQQVLFHNQQMVHIYNWE